MTETVLKALRCPSCRSSLTHVIGDGILLQERLRCAGCARIYPIMGGIPRMADVTGVALEVAKSFGFQWRARISRLFERDTLYGLSAEEERRNFFDALGLRPEELTGKTILDAGCGDGFLLAILGQYPAEVVGIDISTSIEIPHRHCRDRANVTVLQADIFAVPFAAETFDYVWCEGVLTHVNDPRAGFRVLSDLVKPGGRMYVWVYSSDCLSIYQRIRDVVRVAHLLPPWLVLMMCYGLALPLSVVRRVLRPSTRNESFRTVAFALFDNLAPRVQNRFSTAQVRAWFEEAGFTHLRQTGLIGMSGTKVK